MGITRARARDGADHGAARWWASGALLLLLAWSVAWGSAALLLDHAEGRAPGNAKEVDTALRVVGIARCLDPFSPRAWQVIGQLQERRAALLDGDPHALALALHAWRQVVLRQPTNAYAVAALARVLVKTGAPPDEVAAAFSRALALGRQEPGVQRSLLRLGFGAWPVLPQQVQEQVMGLTLDVLTTDPEGTMTIAADAGQWPLLASLVQVLAVEDPALARLAQRFAGRPGLAAPPRAEGP